MCAAAQQQRCLWQRNDEDEDEVLVKTKCKKTSDGMAVRAMGATTEILQEQNYLRHRAMGWRQQGRNLLGLLRNGQATTGKELAGLLCNGWVMTGKSRDDRDRGKLIGVP